MEVSFKVLELISRSLGLPSKHLNEFFKDDMSISWLNSYPECLKPELALGIRGHRDVGALTLIYHDEVGGLEMKCKENGQWVPAPPMPNSFVLNVADCMQVLTNDKYESVEHRAMVNDTRRRLSIPLFLIPSHYVMIKPLDELACGVLSSVVDIKDKRSNIKMSINLVEHGLAKCGLANSTNIEYPRFKQTSL
ncbi:gibberellin 20 oxidase 3-like [Cryptomeria japonica]|uniref:gibberellin 20 oxidase 3-like n=1 Tax=Cryptomeria japonica TaxID=3369 RepID=UPI0027DA75D7|nr:gibberellin 20 oxidase 3-like [Cryptomeria japonica]